MKSPLPYLLLDKNKCLHNIKRMADKAIQHNLAFRPHFKTHQSHLIGRWFKDLGISKITVSSFTMAEYFANDGWTDITVAFPVSRFDVESINYLASKIHLNIVFSSPANFLSSYELINERVGIFIEVDTGQSRSGLHPDNMREIAILIDLIFQKPNFEFNGFLTHAGHTYDARKPEEVEFLHRKALGILTKLKTFWKEKFPNVQISYGDTPSCSISDDFWGIDEIRPGNFVFYDLMQAEIGSCKTSDIAVALICPVVDVYPDRNEAIIHGGAVHLSKDKLTLGNSKKTFGLVCYFDGKTWSEPIEGFSIEKVSQEHGVIKSDDLNSISILKVGDQVAILPVHSCLTTDIMGELFLSDSTRIPTLRKP